MEKFQLKFFQYMCYIVWESHCTKIIVARLLKLIVLYIGINESAWDPNNEPKIFRTRFLKRPGPAEKHFSDNVVTLDSSKKISHRPQPWLMAFFSTLAQNRYMCHSQKYCACKAVLNSSQVITMSVSPCWVLLKSSGMLWGKNPSSGFRFKHENTAFINTTHATKILWIAL